MLLALLFACASSEPPPPPAPPPPPPSAELPGPEEAVKAFYDQVDALVLEGPYDADLVGFTMDAAGGPLAARGPEGWAAVQAVLDGWKADGGTIDSEVEQVQCWVDATLAVCAAEVAQTFTQRGEDAGSAKVRGTFAFVARDGAWVLQHWHESAPSMADPAREE